MHPISQGARSVSTISRTLAAMAVAVSVIAGLGVPPVSSQPASTDSTDAARYSSMPSPEAFPRPDAIGATTVRLQGTQRLFRFDSDGNVIGEQDAQFGTAKIFVGRDEVRTIAGSQYAQLRGGDYAGWWVAAPDAAPEATADYSPEIQVQLASGINVGVRFYAGGTVRVRKSVVLDAPATYAASRRAMFNGRTFLFLTSGPLANRWVALSKAAVLGQTVQSFVSTDAAPSPAPVTPPSVAQPTVAPTPSPTAAPTAPPISAAAPAATWKGLVLLYRETDVTFTRSDGSSYRLQARMSDAMHDLVLDTVGRFRNSVATWSDGLARMNLDVVEVPHALTSLDAWNSVYWVGPLAAEADLNQYAPTGSYDSIFVVWQARDDAGQEVPGGGWGLTLPPGPWANGAGYTSLITPSALWWWTDSTAPEEVFVHEWLHQVIYWNDSQGRLSLDLHAASSYGYEPTDGTFRRWLSDVMTGQVPEGDHFTGVNAAMWAAGQPTAP